MKWGTIEKLNVSKKKKQPKNMKSLAENNDKRFVINSPSVSEIRS